MPRKKTKTKGKIRPKRLTKKKGTGKNIFVGVGISKANDAYKAGKEAVEMAVKKSGKAPEFGLVFCSGSKYGKDEETISQLTKGCHEAFMAANPKCKWAGCTTAGEISPIGSTKSSVVILTISSDYMKFGIGIGENVGKNAKEVGRKATKQALRDLKLDKEMDSYLQYVKTKKYETEQLVKMNPYSIILLGKGPEKGMLPGIPKMYDLEAVLRGVVSAVGVQVPIIGGGSWDDWIFKQNYHMVNGKVYTEAIVVISIFSNLYFASGLAHGFHPTKHVYFVDDSGKSMGGYYIKKINGKNALEVYAKDLKISPKDLKGSYETIINKTFKHPFGLLDPFGESWVRIPGSTFGKKLWFSADMKQGANFLMMDGDEKSFISATKEAVSKALSAIKRKKPAVVIAFSCGCRNMYLGKKITQEIEVFKRSFRGVPIIGFYTFSEFGGTTGYKMGTHNESITVLAITDDLMV